METSDISGKAGRVLVTGGAGFIGSHISQALATRGYSVGVLDNLATGNMENISAFVDSGKIAFHLGDIRDFDTVARVVRQYDVVVHQAALVSVTRSVEDPRTTNEINITGTLNVLKAAVDAKVRQFLYASSSSVYGETETLPKREDMASLPISPYGASKLGGENYCRAFARVYGLKTVSLRYFNVYGPRQKYGPYSGVIPIFMESIQVGKPPTIFGDGSQTRDFTFVSDVVHANVLAIENELNPGEVLNVANGSQTSVTLLAELIARTMGRDDLKPVYADPRKGDIHDSYADIGRARDLLRYDPKYSIEKGISEVVAWFTSPKATA
ncbi:MAG: SDR family oxidoreductase, partial [Thaumarchaeota archaeon]|nr:SDR family oxidoreductase [Nitrososphaerota archaeon]